MIYVTTAAEAAALDARTIQQGTPSLELMRRAGAAAAREVERRYASEVRGGVCVLVGPGNNGGDGWVVADELARRGATVRALEFDSGRRSADSQSMREHALGNVIVAESWTGEALIVDALLGTGAQGAPRDELLRGVETAHSARSHGAKVVSLDMPSGVDATTGEHSATVTADLTVTFGTVKRGQLAARNLCGELIVVDIGLCEPVDPASVPTLFTVTDVAALVPAFAADAHKGTRGNVAIVGGARGMAGAALLAAQGALRTGAGLVRLCVADDSALVAHVAVPAALVTRWSELSGAAAQFLRDWCGAVAIGPGLSQTPEARGMLREVLDSLSCPLVADADALNLFASDAATFETMTRAATEKQLVLTPHPGEMARLLGGNRSAKEVNAQRYDVAPELAGRTRTTVLLKGVPTVIASPDGRRRVCAVGTPALATGGSGDLLTGIVATLLAQGLTGFDAASVGAWAHGRAAELATAGRSSRGVTLSDVVERVRDVWSESQPPLPEGVLAVLPAVA